MATCPRCQRPIALARPTCLYCGAALPSSVPAPATAPAASTASDSTRALLILELAGAEPLRLEAALGITSLEAGQRIRRGGFELLRVAQRSEVEQEVGRLAGHGLQALALPEVEVLPALEPALVRGGSWAGQTMELDTLAGPRPVRSQDLLLVVEGPIAREYQTDQEVRRVRSASLEPGHRFHLHLRSSPQPLELDPARFELGRAADARASVQLTVRRLVMALAGDRTVDGFFSRLLPALGPAATVEGGPLAAAEALRTAPPGDRILVLDNLPQFRFYSAWRAALERRRA